MKQKPCKTLISLKCAQKKQNKASVLSTSASKNSAESVQKATCTLREDQEFKQRDPFVQ